MMRKPWLVLILAMWVSSCAAAHGAPGPAPPAESAQPTAVVLSPGRAAKADGTPLTLTFEGVREDSRCPTGVTCIHAGDVLLMFRIEGGKDGSRPATLRLNGTGRETMHSGYRITLVSVTPHPAAGETIEPSAYRATVQVQRQ